MFLFEGKRVNIDIPITFMGVTYPNLRDPLTRKALRVSEVPDPVYPDPKLYFWTENEDGTINIEAKPEEMVKAAALQDAKNQRVSDVLSIQVTTLAGNTFDGDEQSQGRMARAIVAMEETDVIPWVLSDSSVKLVNQAELKEALKLSGQKMTEIWVKVYE